MRVSSPPVRPTAPHSPFAASLREAERCWGEAQAVIKPDLEALAEREPYAPPGAEDQWRRQLLSRDRDGCLFAAQVAAGRAVTEARSPGEQYEAIVWQALIEGDRGYHQAELHEAQRLVKLQPRNPLSWGALRRAARSSGLRLLAQHADEEEQTLREVSLSRSLSSGAREVCGGR